MSQGQLPGRGVPKAQASTWLLLAGQESGDSRGHAGPPSGGCWAAWTGLGNGQHLGEHPEKVPAC